MQFCCYWHEFYKKIYAFLSLIIKIDNCSVASQHRNLPTLESNWDKWEQRQVQRVRNGEFISL